MKRLLSGFVLLSLFAACHSGTSKTSGNGLDTANAPVMKFESDAYDFGKIHTGDKVSHDYKFTNKGKSPLIISNATATCGCTTPVWPHTPVKPGESGMISVTFNSTGKAGLQDKQVTVTANTIPESNVVHLVGEVLEAKK